jgi:hypothetical protein
VSATAPGAAAVPAPDPTSDALWQQVIDTKRAAQDALDAYIAHHDRNHR